MAKQGEGWQPRGGWAPWLVAGVVFALLLIVVSQSGEAEEVPEDYVFSYRISYSQCEHDPEQLFREAGTRDHLRASEWLGEGAQAGQHRFGTVEGCLDALAERPSQFP